MGRDGGEANSDSLLGNMEAEADILAEGRAGAGLEALLAWTRLLSPSEATQSPRLRHTYQQSQHYDPPPPKYRARWAGQKYNYLCPLSGSECDESIPQPLNAASASYGHRYIQLSPGG